MSRLDDQFDAGDAVGVDTGLARRRLLTAGAGFALAASGLFLPQELAEAHPVKEVGNRAAKRRQRRRHHLQQRRRQQRRQSGGNNPGSGNVVLARGIYLTLAEVDLNPGQHVSVEFWHRVWPFAWVQGDTRQIGPDAPYYAQFHTPDLSGALVTTSFINDQGETVLPYYVEADNWVNPTSSPRVYLYHNGTMSSSGYTGEKVTYRDFTQFGDYFFYDHIQITYVSRDADYFYFSVELG